MKKKIWLQWLGISALIFIGMQVDSRFISGPKLYKSGFMKMCSFVYGVEPDNPEIHAGAVKFCEASFKASHGIQAVDGDGP